MQLKTEQLHHYQIHTTTQIYYAKIAITFSRYVTIAIICDNKITHPNLVQNNLISRFQKQLNALKYSCVYKMHLTSIFILRTNNKLREKREKKL